MLTRHLYEMDEVVSALQICLCSGDDTGLFWLWELVASHEEEAANQLLKIDKGGDWVSRYVYATFLSPARNAEALTKAKKPTKQVQATEEATEFWLGLSDACKRKNVIAAAWFIKTTTLPPTEIYKALTRIDPRAATMSDLPPIAVVRILCERPPSTVAARAKWDSWTALIGRRAARQYAIPATALTPTTTRGSLSAKYTNVADVREPVGLLSEGCKFWQEVLQKRGITMVDDMVCFPNDDVLEQFYEEFFPDDIPDEWSAADQQKSHGRGCKKVDGTPAKVGACTTIL